MANKKTRKTTNKKNKKITNKKTMKGGFFNLFGKKPTPISADCEPNSLNKHKTSTEMHQNYQKCCPKNWLGMKNRSSYCKTLDVNFQNKMKEENNNSGFISDNDDDDDDDSRKSEVYLLKNSKAPTNPNISELDLDCKNININNITSEDSLNKTHKKCCPKRWFRGPSSFCKKVNEKLDNVKNNKYKAISTKDYDTEPETDSDDDIKENKENEEVEWKAEREQATNPLSGISGFTHKKPFKDIDETQDYNSFKKELKKEQDNYYSFNNQERVSPELVQDMYKTGKLGGKTKKRNKKSIKKRNKKSVKKSRK